MNLKDEWQKRKEGILVGGAIGLALYFVARFWLAKGAVESVVAMSAANPSLLVSAGVSPSVVWAIILMVLGAFIGARIDKR